MKRMYDFQCGKCQTIYEELVEYDEKGKYPTVKCPSCKSKKKTKLINSCAFNFSNPVGTDRWNSHSTGHDYRFKHNIPKVKQERETAEALSHMGPNPYENSVHNDTELGTGIFDA